MGVAYLNLARCACLLLFGFSDLASSSEYLEKQDPYTLGLWYFEGKTYIEYEKRKYVEPNKATAVEYFKKAAKQGNYEANERLVEMYLRGDGVEKDYYEAYRYLAQRDGKVHSEEYLKKNYPEALKYIKRAAEESDSEAFKIFGDMFLLGRGVKRSESLAKSWYVSARFSGFGDVINPHSPRALVGVSIFEIGETVDKSV